MRTLFWNAKIWTANPDQPTAQAMLVEDGRIIALGPTTSFASPDHDTLIVDLNGARVLPGFIDAHWHFMALTQDSFYGLETLEAIQSQLTQIAANTKGKGWISDGGWAYSDFPDGIPHRKYIDHIVPDRPVWLAGRDGHMGLANSCALELLGINETTEPPYQGFFERDETGLLTGELKGSALEIIFNAIPPATLDDGCLALASLMARANAHGITSIQNVHQWQDNELHAVLRTHAAGKLTLRMMCSTALVPHGDLNAHTAETALAAAIELREAHLNDPMLAFGSVKAILDGTIDAGTAYMHEPLTDGRNGPAYVPQDDLDRIVTAYDAAGFQVLGHATGDAAITQMIDAIEVAAKTNGTRDSRHRVEHIDIPSDTDLARMKALGIAACSQPNFAYPDATNLENYAVLLGPERTKRAQCYARIDAAGVRQAFGSDYPISSMDHLRAIHTAVSRRRRDGLPVEGWNPQEAISVETALRHLTCDAAWASHRDHLIGTLKPGLFADFVVLSEDILEADIDCLLKAQIDQTWQNGVQVFHAARDGYPDQSVPGRRGKCPCCRMRRPSVIDMNEEWSNLTETFLQAIAPQEFPTHRRQFSNGTSFPNN
jgi:predicted amidohydrolase YtcJ